MDKIEAVKRVICSVLNCELIELSESTDITKIDGYDSLNHIKLIMELESQLSINIPIEDVERLVFVKDYFKYLK